MLQVARDPDVRDRHEPESRVAQALVEPLGDDLLDAVGQLPGPLRVGHDCLPFLPSRSSKREALLDQEGPPDLPFG